MVGHLCGEPCGCYMRSALADFYPRRCFVRFPLQVLRDWYPITTILIFYLEIPPLAQMVLQRYLDDKIIEWEGRLFNGQPSIYLSERFSSRWVSELLHLCYFSYYPIVFGLATLLYFQGRHEAFHEVVFGEILTFNLCLIWYIFVPVMGPYYKFEKIRGPLAGRIFFQTGTHDPVQRSI